MIFFYSLSMDFNQCIETMQEYLLAYLIIMTAMYVLKIVRNYYVEKKYCGVWWNGETQINVSFDSLLGNIVDRERNLTLYVYSLWGVVIEGHWILQFNLFPVENCGAKFGEYYGDCIFWFCGEEHIETWRRKNPNSIEETLNNHITEIYEEKTQ